MTIIQKDKTPSLLVEEWGFDALSMAPSRLRVEETSQLPGKITE
jgi:hypothetical protein